MDAAATQIIGMLITGLVSVLVALVSSNGFWSKIEKKNGLKDKLDEIKAEQDKMFGEIRKEQDRMASKIDENEAKGARRRILRFSDELTQQIEHSKDFFDDVLADIDTYDRYCKDNPDFPNNRTRIAEDNIKKNYSIRLTKNDFL